MSKSYLVGRRSQEDNGELTEDSQESQAVAATRPLRILLTAEDSEQQDNNSHHPLRTRLCGWPVLRRCSVETVTELVLVTFLLLKSHHDQGNL